MSEVWLGLELGSGWGLGSAFHPGLGGAVSVVKVYSGA